MKRLHMQNSVSNSAYFIKTCLAKTLALTCNSSSTTSLEPVFSTSQEYRRTHLSTYEVIKLRTNYPGTLLWATGTITNS